MKVTRLVALVLSLSVILSCGDVSVNADPEASSPNSTVSFQENTAGSSELPPISFGNENSITPIENVSGPALNPRHGEPGHRCDIAVGQPLMNQTAIQPIVSYNSPLATVVPPAANTINLHPAPILNPNLRTVSNPNANFSSKTSTGVLNPRHGEAGHRCDIPVGSPLNSAPSTASTSSTITPTTTQPAVGPGLNPKHGEPGHRCDIAVGQPLNSKPATTSTTSPVTSPTTTSTTTEANVAPGMNPKHGQPGHRCDIAVGQPLNSKPATTSPSSPVTSPTTTPTTTQAAVAPGINPKHGQPGHRCDIASGQPLNSTPSKASPSPATSATDTPSTITPATNNVAVATGMNPKHGQPGHRCDIAVGQPLNSTPTKPSPLPVTSPADTSSITTPSTKGAAAALGLNPKHGQPGHRCDIAVGSPLKSKPAQK